MGKNATRAVYDGFHIGFCGDDDTKKKLVDMIDDPNEVCTGGKVKAYRYNFPDHGQTISETNQWKYNYPMQTFCATPKEKCEHKWIYASPHACSDQKTTLRDKCIQDNKHQWFSKHDEWTRIHDNSKIMTTIPTKTPVSLVSLPLGCPNSLNFWVRLGLRNSMCSTRVMS